MDGIFSINNRKTNYFSFDLEIEGIDAKDAKPRFVIKYRPDYCLMFDCTHDDGDRWNVEIPELPFLERTTYNFVIEVIVDGYYFEGAKGTLNVVGTPEVYVRDVAASKSTDTKSHKEKSDIFKQPERVEYIRGREKPISHIAEEATKQITSNKTLDPVVKEEKPAKDQTTVVDDTESKSTQIKHSLIKEASQSTRSVSPKKVIRRAKSVSHDKKIIETADKHSASAKKAKVIVKKGKQVTV